MTELTLKIATLIDVKSDDIEGVEVQAKVEVDEDNIVQFYVLSIYHTSRDNVFRACQTTYDAHIAKREADVESVNTDRKIDAEKGGG